MTLVAIVALAYAVVAALLAHSHGSEASVGFLGYTATFGLTLLTIPLWHYARSIGRDPRPLRVRLSNAWRTAREAQLSNEGLREIVVCVVLTGFVLSGYNAMKFLIPTLHPYSWDLYLSRAGSWMWGGHPLYVWLLPLFGSDVATHVLDVSYYFVWVIVLWGVYAWQVGGRAEHRVQYVLTFASAWIVLGTLVAVTFASVGPAYYSHFVTGKNPYAPLLAHLAAVNSRFPLMALDVQRSLWQAYQERLALPGAGISAFPSMHVAMAELTAIVGRRSGSRVAAIGLTGFSIAVLIGSVCLGPHYSMDGIVSMFAIHILWRLSGASLRLHRRLAHSRDSSVEGTPENSPEIPAVAARSLVKAID